MYGEPESHRCTYDGEPRKSCFTRFGEMLSGRFCVGFFYMFLRAVTGVLLYLIVFILIFASGPNVADFVA